MFFNDLTKCKINMYCCDLTKVLGTMAIRFKKFWKSC